MISSRSITFTIAATIAASIAWQAQTTANLAVTENKASADKPPVEIISHKIGAEYYPMLDRRSVAPAPMTADTNEMPRTVNEQSDGRKS